MSKFIQYNIVTIISRWRADRIERSEEFAVLSNDCVPLQTFWITAGADVILRRPDFSGVLECFSGARRCILIWAHGGYVLIPANIELSRGLPFATARCCGPLQAYQDWVESLGECCRSRDAQRAKARRCKLRFLISISRIKNLCCRFLSAQWYCRAGALVTVYMV